VDFTDVNKNQHYWNMRVELHMASRMYNLEGFLKGQSSLNATELVEIGVVKGKSLCHLQCHFGQDSISWARLGAKVVGLDFSDKAIEEARKLNFRTSADAEFVCANVLEAASAINQKFDIVFTSYGTIGWIPDLSLWAKQIIELLKPGGFFYIVDFHPVIWMYNNELTEIQYSYFNIDKIEETISGSYANKEAELSGECVGWNHPISEILNALINSGLRLDFLNEFGFSWYDVFPDLEVREQGGFKHKRFGEKIPMMYSIKCTKV
jgi:2-polyprenyl-3-methyl-5-hydroxy-6-metoxy-1,4-benzoquinol methylase